MPVENTSPDTQPETLQASPDLRGVDVDDVAGKPAGEIYGSLSDLDSGLIRYIDVELLGDAPLHVLIPIGHTRLVRTTVAGPRLRLRAATREDLREIPPAEPDTPPREQHEREILSAHARLFHGTTYYAHPAYDHRHLFAGDSPVVAEAELESVAEEAEALAFLSRSRFRIAGGEPDIRGWRVRVADGSDGFVDDLVIDTEARKVRYVVVRGDRDAARRALPVGYVELDRKGETVRVPALSLDELPRVPAIPEAGLDREAEARVLLHLAAMPDGRRRYQRPDFRAPEGLHEGTA
jgi:hypothetical protein